MKRETRSAFMRGLALISCGATWVLIIGLTLPFVQLTTGSELGYHFGFDFYEGMAAFVAALLSTVVLVAITIELVLSFGQYFQIALAVDVSAIVEPRGRSVDVALRPPRLHFAS